MKTTLNILSVEGRESLIQHALKRTMQRDLTYATNALTAIETQGTLTEPIVVISRHNLTNTDARKQNLPQLLNECCDLRAKFLAQTADLTLDELWTLDRRSHHKSIQRHDGIASLTHNGQAVHNNGKQQIHDAITNCNVITATSKENHPAASATALTLHQTAYGQGVRLTRKHLSKRAARSAERDFLGLHRLSRSRTCNQKRDRYYRATMMGKAIHGS
jgi:hypothetical protein